MRDERHPTPEHDERRGQRPLMLLAMFAAIVATIIFAVLLVRGFVHRQQRAIEQLMEAASQWPTTAPNDAASNHQPAEITARITASGVTIEKTLEAMDFAIKEGQSLDARLPSGSFRAKFTVPFRSGNVREAMLGAEFQGGTVMVLHAGKPVLAEAARQEPRIVLSPPVLPVKLARNVDEVTIIFANDGQRPCKLRALWQPMSPEMAAVPQPLPTRPLEVSTSDIAASPATVHQ